MARTQGSAAPRAVIKSSDTFPVSDSGAAGVLILLAVIAAVATAALTGTAFWLSYEHLQEVAAAHGLERSVTRAWAWPATVDMFIVIGEVLILRASLMHRVDWWAIGLAVAGSLGSIALNVAGVGAGARPLDYVVAAVPPVAALLAFGALMRQVHEAIARRVATPAATHPVAVQRTPVAAICAAVAPVAVRPAAWVGAAPADVRLLPLVAATATAATPPVAVPLQGRGEMLTTSEVAERLNVSPETVRSWKRRHKLTPVATDPDGGAHLFDARDVEKLRGAP
ncbi:DUF2637 domain-containing protein [Streptomyces sp. NPDC046925]|uniref:DUF2637 domain-containing protein n=1 Tax=Streptomyces sp. NPDC046925 TaxID=3155375 RepID=UPI0033F34855